MGRAPCCEKVGLKKGRWTAEEDEILAKYIKANGEGSWRSLPKNAGLLRCGKSCRLRWINYLRAGLKRGNISAEEENTIVKLHASLGNRNAKEYETAARRLSVIFWWSLIANHLPGRTDNEIKNYWNSHLSRKIYSYRGAGAGAGIMDTPKVVHIPAKRKGGRTSRWAMKKNKTYTQNVNATINQRHTQISFPQQNSDTAVPPPPTPSLESEGLSNAINDFTVLDGDVAEVDKPGKEELEAEVNKCDKCVGGVEESSTTDEDILGLCELPESINEGSGVLLGFSDILESCITETTCGVWDISEERESNDVVASDACRDKMASSEDSVNEESGGEWNPSCSSIMGLGLDQDWDWESVIEFSNVVESEACDNWEHQEKLLTWLWEDDDWETESKRLGETDTQILQNDMVDWFLS